MWKKLLLVFAVCGCMLQVSQAQEANPALVDVAKAMGAIDLKSLQYTGERFPLCDWPESISWAAVGALQR